jgi:hypothetical protein
VIEIVYRGAAVAPILDATSIINWVISILFVLLSLMMTKYEQRWPMYFICPLLTLLSFYYYTYHDLERTTAAIYYLIMIQVTTHFLFLVAFSETWILSLATFIGTITVFLLRVGVELLSQTRGELAVQVIYCSLVYAVIAYTSEKHRKEAFIGREQSERSFTKWLKIFETFPEGIAYIRGKKLVGHNSALNKILSLEEKYKEAEKRGGPTDEIQYTERSLYGNGYTSKVTPREILPNDITSTFLSINLEPFNGNKN